MSDLRTAEQNQLYLKINQCGNCKHQGTGYPLCEFCKGTLSHVYWEQKNERFTNSSAAAQPQQDVTLTNEGDIPKIGCVNHDCASCKENAEKSTRSDGYVQKTAKNEHEPVYKVSKAFLQGVCKIMDEIEGTGHYQMDVHDYAVMTLKDEPVVRECRTPHPSSPGADPAAHALWLQGAGHA
jgi:hypothetical protein